MNPKTKSNGKKKLFSGRSIATIVAVVVLVALAVVAWNINNKRAEASNFTECKDAGGVVVDGTTSTCEINGKTFKEADQNDDSDKAEGDANTDIAREYLGMSEKDAFEKAKKDDTQARIVERDGKRMMVTMDLRPGRINLTVEDGTVTGAEEEAPNAKRSLSQ